MTFAWPAKADKRGCGWIISFVSIATNAPQQHFRTLNRRSNELLVGVTANIVDL
jgi:hypothetical protein